MIHQNLPSLHHVYSVIPVAKEGGEVESAGGLEMQL